MDSKHDAIVVNTECQLHGYVIYNDDVFRVQAVVVRPNNHLCCSMLFML